MPHPSNVDAAHQRARWLRSDVARFLRPDAAKFLKPGTDPADVYPALAPRRDSIRRPEARAFDNVITQERAILDDLRDDLAQIKSDLLWRRFVAVVIRKYSASQPRVPSGSGRESGRWTSGRHGGSAGASAQGAGTSETPDESAVDGSDNNPGFDGTAGDGETSGSNDDFDSGNSDHSARASTSDSNRSTGINDNRVVSDADPEVVKPGEQYAAGERRVGNGQNFDLTPGQAARLSVAQSRAEDSIARIREIDPNWKPTPSLYQSAEGMILAYEGEAIQAQARASELAAQRLLPGPFAGESIPARSSGRSRTADEQRELNRIGSETGCHSCGTTNSGLPSGNFIGDHQPPSALNSAGLAQRLFPHCASCSSSQGPAVQRFSRKR